MTDTEILKKVIEKACDNSEVLRTTFQIASLNIPELVEGGYKAIIFDHDFAKAFWGEVPLTSGEAVRFDALWEWQYHLKQMVLEENPIKYLEKFI